MNPEQWLSLKWNGGSTMSDRWLNQSKIIQLQLWRSTMRAKRRTKQEQYEIIMECRQSRLSDHQWCL